MIKITFFDALKDDSLRAIISGLAFIVLVATASHVLFSPLGFNPTDDGLVLAGSRRIIEGQIPHRDFIWFHTTGSLFIHAPFVLLGGEYVFLLSRYFIWIQFATIAWTWTVVITRSFRVFTTIIEKFSLAVIAFVFSVHYFPIMAWYTIDGLFLGSVGIMLCDNTATTSRTLGYVLIGSASLCKQVFLPMIPITVILLNDWRQLKYWSASITPIAIYGVYLMFFGAMNDAILQLTTYSGSADFASVILGPYLIDRGINGIFVLSGILVGAIVACLLFYSRKKMSGVVVVSGIVLLAIFTLVIGSYRIRPAFGVFGAVIGSLIYYVVREKGITLPYIRSGLLAVFIAWSASLSLGYKIPTLGTGPLLVFLLSTACCSFQTSEENTMYASIEGVFPGNFHTLFTIFVLAAMISSLVAFGVARQNYIYREQSASQLTYDLGDVLPGARGIKTNNNTYAFFVDLEYAKVLVEQQGKDYCIIPDVAANWVKDSQPNPIPCDWPHDWELGRKELFDRVIDDLNAQKGELIIIVEKYETRSLAEGFYPPADETAIVDYVRSHFIKTGETQYFELFE